MGAPLQDETERHVRLVVMTPFGLVLAWAQLLSGWPLDGSLHEGLVAVTWHWYETQGGGLRARHGGALALNRARAGVWLPARRGH